MWASYVKMTEHMPDSSMRIVDRRPKFPAFLVTYSQTKLDIDFVYRKLLTWRFEITEVVVEKHMDGGEHIHAMLICEKGRKRKLSPDSLRFGGERPNVRGKGLKDIYAAKKHYGFGQESTRMGIYITG